MKLSDTMRRLHPTPTPSAGLVSRIETMADASDRKAQLGMVRWRRLPFVLATALAVSVYAATTLFSTPKMSLARTMEIVYTNMQKAQNVHYTLAFSSSAVDGSISTRPGSDWLVYENWRLGDLSRVDYRISGKPAMKEMIIDGVRWYLFPDKKWATFQNAGSSPATVTVDMESLQQSAIKAFRDPNRTDLGIVTENGQQFRKVAATTTVQRSPFLSPEPGRSVFVIDEARLLPVRMEQQVLESGSWHTVSWFRYDFNVSRRDFTIPADYQRYSMSELGKVAGAPFARPIAQKKFATRTIAVRDVQVNQDGDVFVLYTDGSTPQFSLKDQSVVVVESDSRGTRYIDSTGGIDTFMRCADPASNRGMVVDGQVLSGFCSVPVKPRQGKWLPRTVNIEAHFIEYVGKKAYTRHADFTVPVSKPRTALLPTYAPYLTKLSLAGGDPMRFRRDRAAARRVFYSQERDQTGALRLTNEEIREGIADGNTYLTRAEIFCEQKQWDSARKELARAEGDDAFGFYKTRIAALRKEIPGP